LAIQEAIAAAKNVERIGSAIEVLVDGPAEEDGRWLEGRHEGLAPEIDGVVYIDRSAHTRNVAGPGDCVKVLVTDAAMYDLTGHVLGETTAAGTRRPEERSPRGGYR
jgi:ribosomal protein S12 methylthiotransferase